MTSSISHRLARLRRRLRVTTVLLGASLLVAVVGGAVLLAGLVDWLVHLDDAGVRCLIGVAILTVAAWIAVRYLAWPLRRGESDVRLALEVERRYPVLRDGFASTVAFLEGSTTGGECDPRLGSPALQRRTIDETERLVERVDVDGVVRTRPARNAALAAIGVCLAVVVIGLVRPAEASTALERLLFPFSARDWPRSTDLEYVDERLVPFPLDPDRPLRRAEGETLELFVVNRLGELPREVDLETRIGDTGETTSRRLRRITLRGPEGEPHEVFKLSLPIESPAGTRAGDPAGRLAFRVVGGDDRDAPFQPLDVVPPPSLASLRVSLVPPAYTGESPHELPEGAGHVSALVGTRIDVAATTTKPVRRVRLHVRDRVTDVPLAADDRSFRTSFVVAEPGVYSYWFQLRDEEGVENVRATRYEVRGTADLVPTVTIEEPAVDGRVTPRARLPLVIVARDDLGTIRLERVHTIERTTGEREEERRIVLWSGKPAERWESRSVWNLAELGVAPGDRILLHGEAFDARAAFQPPDQPADPASTTDPDPDPDTDAKQPDTATTGSPTDGGGTTGHSAEPPESYVGRSLVRTLVVVTDDEKQREIDAVRATLEDELDRVADGQRAARDRTADLLVQRRTVGRLRERDVDVLKGVELDQRRTAEQLANPTEGVLPRAERLLRELEDNDLRDSEVRRNLETLVDELRFLREHELSRIESNLTAARKQAVEQAGPADEVAPDEPATAEDDSLSAAHDGQTRVVETLDDLLARLSKSRTRRELEGDLDDLLAQQRSLRDGAAELAGRTLGKAVDELPEQDRAELAKLAGRQRTRAEEVDRLRRRLEATANALDDTTPAAAELLRDAAQLLGERATAAAMTSAADQLDRNDVGRAVDAQERALDDLGDVRSTLDDRAVTDTETLVRQLRDAEDELGGFREEQAELLRRTRAVIDDPDESSRDRQLETLEKQQRDLRERVARAARRLGRLQARNAAGSARRAADRMDDVERLLKDDAVDRVEELQRESHDDLEQAQREVAEARREAEERLARELLETVAGELASMIERERGLVAETERLQREIAERGNPSRGHNATLRTLAEVQRTLQGQTDRLADRLAAVEVFVLALRGTSAEMARAADRLADRRADDRTLAIERSAVRRLEALVAALEPDENGSGESPPNDGGGGPGDQPPTPEGESSLVSAIAQLRLLRSIQEELLARTGRLDERREGDRELSLAEVDEELESIATEQERIADIARAMVEALTGGPASEDGLEEPNDDRGTNDDD